ncbi:hypothetical protein H4R33_006270, partial [Dimargaris cristalligena]
MESQAALPAPSLKSTSSTTRERAASVLCSPRSLIPKRLPVPSISVDLNPAEGTIHMLSNPTSPVLSTSAIDSFRCASRLTFDYNSDSSSELDLAEYDPGHRRPPIPDTLLSGQPTMGDGSGDSISPTDAGPPSIFATDSVTFESDLESESSYDPLDSSSIRRGGHAFGFIRPTSSYPIHKIDKLRAEMARRAAEGFLPDIERSIGHQSSALDTSSMSIASTKSSLRNKTPLGARASSKASPATTMGVREMDARMKGLQHENSDLRIQLFSLREKLAKYNSTSLEDMEETVRKYHGQLERFYNENAQLTDDRQRLQAQVDKLLYEVEHPAPCTLEHGISAEQETMLNRALADSQTMRQQIEQLREENETLQQNNRELIESRATLLNQTSELSSDHSILKSQLDLAKGENEVLVNRLHQAAVEITEVKENLLCYEGQVHALQKEVSYYRAQCNPVESPYPAASPVGAHHKTSRLTTPPHSACGVPFPRINRRASNLSSVSSTYYLPQPPYGLPGPSSDAALITAEVGPLDDTATHHSHPYGSPRPALSHDVLSVGSGSGMGGQGTRARGASVLASPTPDLAGRALYSRLSHHASPRPRGFTEASFNALATAAHGMGGDEWMATKVALDSTIEKLQFELRDARQLNLDKSKKITDLEAQLNMTVRSLKAEDLGHRQRLDYLQEKVAKYNHERTVLAEENESLRQRYDDYQRRVEELDEAYKEAQITTSRLQQELRLKDGMLQEFQLTRGDGSTTTTTVTMTAVAGGGGGTISQIASPSQYDQDGMARLNVQLQHS